MMPIKQTFISMIFPFYIFYPHIMVFFLPRSKGRSRLKRDGQAATVAEEVFGRHPGAAVEELFMVRYGKIWKMHGGWVKTYI